MGYYEFTITAPEEAKDALLNRMSEMGSLGSYERGDRILAYFPDSLDIIKLRDGLHSFRETLKDSGLDHGFTFDYVFLAERDWNESWKKKFEPIDVGENLSIVPPWDRRENGRTNIIVDPGMAFGTGHHETTRTCLALIERLSRSTRKEAFLDIGTGTGILAIAASKLGYQRVAGVDIDPLAVDAARRNAALNDLENIAIQEGTVSDINGLFDLIAANLMSEVLIRIAPAIAARLDKHGIALLSGMLVGQEEGVLAAMAAAGLSLKEKFIDGRWVSLVVGR